MKIEFFLGKTLMDLLKEKSIDSIHVKDLIGELGICKGTFYKYYQDKYDLVVHVFEEKFYRKVSASTWEDFVTGCLSQFRRSPEIIYNAFLSNDINSIANYHRTRIKKIYLENRAERGLPAEGQEIEYAVNIFTWLVNETMMVWLKGGCVEDEKDVLAMIKCLMPHILYED